MRYKKPLRNLRFHRDLVREAGLEFRFRNFKNFFTLKTVILRSESQKIGTVCSIVFEYFQARKGHGKGQNERSIFYEIAI